MKTALNALSLTQSRFDTAFWPNRYRRKLIQQ
jgi:hypothetical protein